MCEFITFLKSIDYSSFMAGGFGAAFGALVAFGLAKMKDKNLQKDKEFSSLVKVQITLITQYNFLKSFRLKYLEKHRESKNRSGDVRRVNFPLNRKTIDVTDLSFLTENENPNILLKLNVSQTNYLSTIDALIEFNDYKLMIEKAEQKFDPETKTIVTLLKPQELHQLIELTDNLYTFFDKSEDEIRNHIQEMEKVISRNIPEKKVLGIKG